MGRIGRLLIPLYLVSNGLLAKPSLYLSDFFERNRGSYCDALTRVRVSGDLTHWVRFFLQGVAETSAKGRDTFGKILTLRIDVEQRILTLGKRVPNARAALNLLYRRPFVAAADLDSDVDGNVESRKGTISVFNGPEPAICSYTDAEAESQVVGAWLRQCSPSGVLPQEMLYVACTRARDQLRVWAVKPESEFLRDLSQKSFDADGSR